MKRATDNLQIESLKKIPIPGIDYIETDDTFTIFNVPILAEMTQRYDEGIALKSADEILKVEVDNIPLTIVDHAPTHPKDLLEELDTLDKSEVQIGFMSEPSRPKATASDTKRYADFVFFQTPKIDALKEEYKDGKKIDTSIGFKFAYDWTPGELNGQKYDFIQTNITLDHNAVLISRDGNIGTGRMPSPIGGIGADMKMKGKAKDLNSEATAEIQAMANKINQDNPDMNLDDAYVLIQNQIWDLREQNGAFDANGMKMSDALQKQIDSLTKQNGELTAEIDAFKGQDVQKKMDALSTERDELKTANDTLTSEKADLQKKVDEMQPAIDKLEADKKEAIDSKRAELKEKLPGMDEILDAASDELIVAKHDELAKTDSKNPKDIGADMSGVAATDKKSEQAKAKDFLNRGDE